MTPPFNERNGLLVWRESLIQVGEMLKMWAENGKGPLGGVKNTPNDTTALALNVRMAAGFRKGYHFEGATQVMETGDGMVWIRIGMH